MHEPYQWPEIVFFDGHCILCNSSVDFLLRKDKKRKLKYASLQSDLSKSFLLHINKQALNEDTVIFYHQGQLLVRSDAVLKIAGLLGFPYSLLIVFKIIPRPWRDNIYDYIARNRLSWFGRNDNCRVPDESTSERIIG
jgi:predicted DCC family thiol-disulfide oxidoreductase YuxK